jgi:hypothetical protein
MCLRFSLRAVTLVLFASTPFAQAASQPSNRQVVLEHLASLPLGFEQNVSEVNKSVDFVCHAAGYSISLSRGELLVVFADQGSGKQGEETLRISLAGADKKVEPQGIDLLPGVTNYYIGNDPAQWKTNVRQFRQVRYHNVYPGVDLVFYGNHRQLEFDFALSPGADASSIGLTFDGATVQQHGQDLELVTPSGNIAVLKKPELYQGEGRARHRVSGGYAVRRPNEVAFVVGKYDTVQPLLIDPALIYSTLAELDTGSDSPVAVIADSTGAAYIMGQMPSTTRNFNAKLFVAKFNSAGSALIYESYVGSIPGANSSSHTSGEEIVVDANENVYVTGRTNDPNFPTTQGTFSPTQACVGCEDPFAFKLNASGKLVYSTFLVQPLLQSLDTAAPFLSSIAVDSSGALYATGTVVTTNDNGIPTQVPGLTTTPGAFQTKRNNASSAFVLKLHPDGSALDYSTYLGGGASETPGGIAVDASGVAYVDGGTSSSDFPTTQGAFQKTNAGTSGFFSKLKADGSGLIYSTFLGAAGIQSNAMAIAVDSSQSAYLTGLTTGPGFPTTVGAFKTNVSGTGSFNFASKFDSSGNLSYSTYVGDGVQAPDSFTLFKAPTTSIFVDGSGAAYTSGITVFAAYPSVASIFPPPSAGFPVEFITKINSAGSALVYSTFPNSGATAVDANGNAYVAGLTLDRPDPTSPTDLIPSLPTTLGAFQPLPVCFDPTCAGPRMFLLKIASSLGSAVPILSPHQVSFSTILQKGTTGVPRTIQIGNYGDADLTVTGISISGANAGDFASADSSACVKMIPVGGSCSLHVTFTANVAVGTSNAVVNLNFGGGLASQAVPLKAQAGFPIFQFGPNPVDFGNSKFPAEGSFNVANVTFTNSGTGPLHFLAQPLLTGADPQDFCPAGNAGGCDGLSMGGAIPPGSTVHWEWRFLPQAAGTRTAQLVFQTDAAGSPETFTLTGNAIPAGHGTFSIAPANGSSTSSTITAGQMATYNLIVAAANNFGGGTIAVSCSGAPTGASCNVSPGSFSLRSGASQNLTVSVTAMARTSASLNHTHPALWWSLATVIGMVAVRPRRRRSRGMLMIIGTFALCGAMISCSGGSGGGGQTGTPAGKYALTVTASANGSTNSTSLTLIVK